MNLFEAVKQNVTTRQAAEFYGIHVKRHGMAVCPFHNDKNPSMKVDKRFHCFACQSDGDAVDFVSRPFGLPSKEAAMKIADDFGIGYDSRQRPSIRPKIREPTPEQKYQQEENHCYKVLSDYFHVLRDWEKQYAPQRMDDVWHPLFVEALQRKSHVEYQLDIDNIRAISRIFKPGCKLEVMLCLVGGQGADQAPRPKLLPIKRENLEYNYHWQNKEK